ncbi:MAG: hypothetical protein LBR73_04765 [Oscillospiraceae bacterium]|jgi:hypothetical protein|nr:hypothetical protein [Oscillospiraceae bacterium]
MKTGKRILAMLLAVLMLFGVSAVSASAHTYAAGYYNQVKAAFDSCYDKAIDKIEGSTPLLGTSYSTLCRQAITAALSAVSGAAGWDESKDTETYVKLIQSSYNSAVSIARDGGVTYPGTGKAPSSELTRLLNLSAAEVAAGSLKIPGTNVDANFFNWFLYIICFGWLWMEKA